MRRTVRAGAEYFALVFGFGFVLGTLRHGVMMWGWSRQFLVALELPVILAFAWWAAGLIISRLSIPADSTARLGMGATMLALLWTAEGAVGSFLMGQTLSVQFANAATPGGLLERSAQVIAALFPFLQGRLRP